MNIQHVASLIDALQETTRGATIAPRRNAADFYADRLRVATTAGDNLLAVINRFTELLGSPVLRGETVASVAKAAASEDAPALLAWLRDQPKVAIALTYVKRDERGPVLEAVADYTPQSAPPVQMRGRRTFDITIRAEMESPLVHGDDKKAGNSTLFRRAKVRGGAELPYYAANAFVGQMRDLLAMHYLASLGFDPRRPKQLQIWAYHLLFSGGIMADGAIPKAFERSLAGAASGSINVDGNIRLRNMIPFFSMLGGVGKYPMEGRIYVSDLRPECREWGNGNIPIVQLLDWRYITRRDDYEGKVSNAQVQDADLMTLFEAANTSMIVNVECLIEGTVLEGGIDLSRHITDLELSALARGLELMREYGYLGGKVHRGFGRVHLEYSGKALDPASYDRYLAERGDDIRAYLTEIGALVEGE